MAVYPAHTACTNRVLLYRAMLHSVQHNVNMCIPTLTITVWLFSCLKNNQIYISTHPHWHHTYSIVQRFDKENFETLRENFRSPIPPN
jgi:hypothetical protein